MRMLARKFLSGDFCLDEMGYGNVSSVAAKSLKNGTPLAHGSRAKGSLCSVD
jgi:hypothetical protein